MYQEEPQETSAKRRIYHIVIAKNIYGRVKTSEREVYSREVEDG